MLLRVQTHLCPGVGDARYTWCLLRASVPDGSESGRLVATPGFAAALAALVDLAPADRREYVLAHASWRFATAWLEAAGAPAIVHPAPGAPLSWPHPAWFVFDLAPVAGLNGLAALAACLDDEGGRPGDRAQGDAPSHRVFEVWGVPAGASRELAALAARTATMCAEEERLPEGVFYRLSPDPHQMKGAQVFLAGDRLADVADALEGVHVEGLEVRLGC